MIVRWELASYSELLAELGIAQPLVVTTPRWTSLELAALRTYDGVRSHAPAETVEEAAAAAAGADGLVALGGGSAIDTAKAVSARTGLPVLSIPTTYSGAEWTPFYGVRDEARRVKGGGGGADVAGILYDTGLTLGLPVPETVGTALNALAHCAEALYVRRRNADADAHALAGAALIGDALPAVVADRSDWEARRRLLEGAMHAGAALAGAGLGLGHALAQALGGRYGIAHGTANAVCLAPALRFNAEDETAWDALGRLARALEVDDAVDRVEELAALGGFGRLRDLGVPEDELAELAASVVVRAGAKANPRPASAAEVEELYRSIW